MKCGSAPTYTSCHNWLKLRNNIEIHMSSYLQVLDKSGRANFVATPATSTYDYSNGMYLPQKEVAAIDLVWPSTSNSALSNLLCFVVSDV